MCVYVCVCVCRQMEYVGRLKTGKVFDSNKKFKFRLGVGEVIKVRRETTSSYP